MVVDRLRKRDYTGLPDIYNDRLTQPLENKNRRFSSLNDVIKLTKKINRLKNIKGYLNPDNVEGSRTRVLENLEVLTFFGFNHNELKEITHIVMGHTPLGNIISGKMNEKALKPVSDLARTYEPRQALNLLRYCRLMTMAETEAARGSNLTQEELEQLFDLYESTVKVVTNRDLDWDSLLDEKITAIGGIHNKIVRKLLMMMNHFEFLGNWSELSQKGQMEKECLADYDDQKLYRIENVINLVKAVEQFEEMYLKFDPLQLPVFYRKFLDIEFHGTGHLFERMDSQHVFTLLWITVNLARGEVINFNPILSDIDASEIEGIIQKVANEVSAINIHNLDLGILKDFGEQLYQNRTSFVVGTGIQLRVTQAVKALEVNYMDMDKDIQKVKNMAGELAGRRISEIPVDDLRTLEVLFSKLESFSQSHLRLIRETDHHMKLPSRENRWFQETQELAEQMRSKFLEVIFRPEDLHTDLDLLYRNSPSLLTYILPEFTALQHLDFSWHLYLKSPVTHYIMKAAKKFQALARHDKESFQDALLSHRLAQKEFGPMATGIVGASASQIDDLEKIVEHLRSNKPLFAALVKSFIFQDIGRISSFRKKYSQEIHPADLAHVGAFFIEKEKIAERYYLDEKGKSYLVFLVRHHSLLHQIIRGELSFYSIQDAIDARDKDLFEAFFLFSFIMISAIREDLIVEDLANRLFQIRALCHRIIDGETTLEAYRSEVFIESGAIFHALETYRTNGLPQGVTPVDYLESCKSEPIGRSKCIASGRMIFAMERLFRLRGIRHVEFLDLANLMLKVPLKFIYKKRKFSSIGYATFEKELFEAFRIYNTLQNLPEDTRHFILNRLIEDKARIFGYEKVSNYLSYGNQVKLLLAGLMGTKKFKSKGAPICLNFLGMSKEIEKRYEAVNDFLNTLSVEELWGDKSQLDKLLKARTGLIFSKEDFPNVLSIKFEDQVNISKKISYMNTISNVEQLKNYFHSSLKSLRKHPFHTDDYELQLEKVFERRLKEITDIILNQTKKQMDLIEDFLELQNLVNDLIDRSWDIGFSEGQKHRLTDLYELRKDSITREKLSEIDTTLKKINDIQELKDYWDSIKWYLQSNRRFFGKEFEHMIAKKFDRVNHELAIE